MCGSKIFQFVIVISVVTIAMAIIVGVREGCTKLNPEKVWSFAKPGGGLGG